MKRVFLRAALLPFAIATVVAQTPPSNGGGSVTEDLSQGRTFTFEIAPKLPAFTFKLIPLVQPPDKFGNAESIIRDIETYREGSKEAPQHLTGCDFDGMEPPGRGARFFRMVDINFDGYNDIFLETMHGATGNLSGCVWLYNPATERFEYSESFSSLSHFWLDPDRKVIFTFERGGMLGFVHSAGKYAIENNRPALLWLEVQDWDESKSQLHCIVKERRGAEMVVVRDIWSKVGDKDPPCDPSALFTSSLKEP